MNMYRGLKPLSKEQLAGAKEHVMSGVEAPASVSLNRIVAILTNC